MPSDGSPWVHTLMSMRNWKALFAVIQSAPPQPTNTRGSAPPPSPFRVSTGWLGPELDLGGVQDELPVRAWATIHGLGRSIDPV